MQILHTQCRGYRLVFICYVKFENVNKNIFGNKLQFIQLNTSISFPVIALRLTISIAVFEHFIAFISNRKRYL